jgi:alpha-beta hydrolase superfamily lysophospholipase
VQTKFITTDDKIELFVCDWRLPENAEKRGAVLIIHGLGEHCGRYAHVAEFLNSNGFEVRGYDQRGHGRSTGARGDLPYEVALLDDAKFTYDDFAENNSEKIFLLGHSMGGALALRAAIEKIVAPRGLILSSPAVTAKLSLTDKLKLNLGRLTPHVAVSNGLKIEYISHDPQVIADYRNDPLIHYKITPALANFILDSGQESLKKAPNFSVPTLLLIAGDDRLVDSAGARRLFEKLPKETAEIHVYENLYHETLNESAEARAQVFADLKDWLFRQIS